MNLKPHIAQPFISGYQVILFNLAAPRETATRSDFLARLVDGRQQLVEAPAHLDVVLKEVRAKGIHISLPVEQAIRTLRVDNWIYLKDTRYYSVFLDSNEEWGLGVMGLNDRLRDLVGGPGVFMKTGIVEYAGQYVCDGLIEDFVYIGPNYRRSFNDAYQAMRKSGDFQRRPSS